MTEAGKLKQWLRQNPARSLFWHSRIIVLGWKGLLIYSKPNISWIVPKLPWAVKGFHGSQNIACHRQSLQLPVGPPLIKSFIHWCRAITLRRAKRHFITSNTLDIATDIISLQNRWWLYTDSTLEIINNKYSGKILILQSPPKGIYNNMKLSILT